MSEDSTTILFHDGRAIASGEISRRVKGFEYKDAVRRVIRGSSALDGSGKVFVSCAALVLSRFGMTRGGPFRGVRIRKDGSVNGMEILLACWERVGVDLMDIRSAIPRGGSARDRHLLELSESGRAELTARVWLLTKRLLPVTMGQTSYGLVGASKILFAVLPEIVLPVDNKQWLTVFKTVDLGDVIHVMVSEVRDWENQTGEKLNEMDRSRELTTVPSVYNVMAMAARP